MPLHVHVDADREVIFVQGEGIVTDQDLLEYVDSYLTGKNLHRFDEFFDLSAADLLDLTYKGLSSVAEAAASTDPDAAPTKIGILVSETAALGISRMYQTLRESKGGRRFARVFWDESECREWLGIDS